MSSAAHRSPGVVIGSTAPGVPPAVPGGGGLRERLGIAAAAENPRPERHGFHLESAARLFRITTFFHRCYFRVETFGIGRVPPGPVLLIANHGSSVLAWDGAMIVTSCLWNVDPPRLVHGMAEHRLMELPILGRAARAIGAVDGRREACIDLLRAGAAVLAFPEGAKVLGKPFRDRYQLWPFTHGFMHVALATGAPVVPIGVVGSEEEAPLLANPRWLARLIGTPVAPLTPTLFVPFPAKYRIHFGEPMTFRGSSDASNVTRNVATVRGAVQKLVERGLAQRSHVFW